MQYTMFQPCCSNPIICFSILCALLIAIRFAFVVFSFAMVVCSSSAWVMHMSRNSLSLSRSRQRVSFWCCQISARRCRLFKSTWSASVAGAFGCVGEGFISGQSSAVRMVNALCVVVGVGLAILGWNPFVTTFQHSSFDASFSVSLFLSYLLLSVVTIVVDLDITLLVVLGAGASLSVRTKSTLASSCRIALSDAPSCLWLYFYFAWMICNAGWNSRPNSLQEATSMLAMSVSTICEVAMLIPCKAMLLEEIVTELLLSNDPR